MKAEQIFDSDTGKEVTDTRENSVSQREKREIREVQIKRRKIRRRKMT